MRRKNRVMKIYLDIPDQYESDEEFLEAVADKLDGQQWELELGEGDDTYKAIVRSVAIGDVEIDAEEEEEED